jgi:hypothetical protein
MPVYPGAHNQHRPHRALGLEPPDPAAGFRSSLRITEPEYTGVTCSAVCCTSTDELHECIYAPYALVRQPGAVGEGALEQQLVMTRVTSPYSQ